MSFCEKYDWIRLGEGMKFRCGKKGKEGGWIIHAIARFNGNCFHRTVYLRHNSPLCSRLHM